MFDTTPRHLSTRAAFAAVSARVGGLKSKKRLLR